MKAARAERAVLLKLDTGDDDRDQARHRARVGRAPGSSSPPWAPTCGSSDRALGALLLPGPTPATTTAITSKPAGLERTLGALLLIEPTPIAPAPHGAGHAYSSICS